jgi:gamma-glutamylcyclotransferase (GGCT)/AIG2-like uncharacterized protein YtfP
VPYGPSRPRTLGHRFRPRRHAGAAARKGTLVNVSATERADAPIYALLVRERGDVLAEVRRIAEQTWQEVDQARTAPATHATQYA